MIISPLPIGTPPILRAWLDAAYTLLFANQQSGTMAQRPTTTLWIGRRYFDTTLGIPIWIQSVTASVAVWCDATGAPV